MQKIRFKRKTYGWGWTPSTWEGWISVLVYILAIRGILWFADQGVYISTAEGVHLCILLTILLIAVSYVKGEKPRRQWGNKNIKK